MAKKAMAHSVKHDVWRKMDSSILIETVGNYRWERERAMHRKMEASQIQNTKQALLKKWCVIQKQGVCSILITTIVGHLYAVWKLFSMVRFLKTGFSSRAELWGSLASKLQLIIGRQTTRWYTHAARTGAGHNNISESGIEETWDLEKCFFWLSFCWRQQSCLR